ncbi:hypothetical protein [Salinimicrobium xinjiangense]|uniref:hypothetical protein n=1 Tax=Salinimicrobium xinjiangense TaxID=438596 RepID=UPI00040D3E80|nr:hypothetical protein [Salinimicrobium xinjiangense]
MNLKNLFFAAILILSFSACRETVNDDHGHEHEDGTEHAHDENGAHMSEDHMEQEEFEVGEDTLHMHEESNTHTHDDGNEHHDH